MSGVLRDFVERMGTPLGRRSLMMNAFRRTWPVLSRAAGLYRRTVLRRTRIVTVVGSYGKTSTTYAVLTALGGAPHPGLQRGGMSFLARNLLRIGILDRHAVLEVGILRPGEMAPYAQMIRPDIVAMTWIGSEHNRSFGTKEAIRLEKAEMVKALPSSGLAVLNGDDPNVLRTRELTRARVVTYGFGENCDVRASEVSLADWPHGTHFTVHAGGEERRMSIRLIGRPMVYPVLAAVAVAQAEGLSLDQVLPGLSALTPIPGRMEPVQLPSGAIVLRDDFKSALETVDAALDVLAEIPAKRRIVVLGRVSEPMGSQGDIYRRLGARIASIATKAILVCGTTSNYPLSAGAVAAGMPRSSIVKAGDNIFAAVKALEGDLGPGDVVLVKGRTDQRLDRITFSLVGRAVGCRLSVCRTKVASCYHCPMLEQGWGRSRPAQ
jgi:UDP-N-acetylmuramyl pentapeptide synthase